MGKHLTTREDVEAAIRWRLAPVPGDRRDPWTHRCALKAKLARMRGDIDSFWSAGVEVVQAHRAAQRASEPRGGDALTDAQAEFFRDNQGATPAAAWTHFAGVADMGLEPFDDFDGERIGFTPAPGRPITYITKESFLRRARRVKKILAEVGQQGAHVRRMA